MNTTKKITFCAVLSALATVIMFVSYFPYLTYAIPALAGLCVMVVVIETGCKWALFSYLTSSFLAFLFAETESKILYIMFFGFYPIIKCIIEKIGKRVVEWILKFSVFNVAIIASYLLFSEIFMISMEDLGPLYNYGGIILLVLGNFVFVLYDIAISRMAMLYINRLHSRVIKLLK